ncbi:MAG: TetR family transcriptional regulator, partial [Myxococcales bacterium]|nr:TetR family transcriptional regulator [Myxococcales bacterium]
AGVAKGTMYLYFENKDELYMALLEYRARLWAASAIEALKSRRAPLGIEDVVDAISGHIFEHHEVLILGTIANSSMEVDIDRDDELTFRAGLAELMRQVGEALEKSLPGLKPGMGATMFMRSLAYILGIWQLIAPDPAMEVIRERAELAPFRLEFEREVKAGLTALWAGTITAVAATRS